MRWIGMTVLGAALCATASWGAEIPEIPAEPLPLTEQEQKFADLLTKASLIGGYGARSGAREQPKPERYDIQSMTKVSDGKWLVMATMSFKDVNVPIPIPVEVRWAGDTPMMQVTDLAIPLLGSGFSARILFYDSQYSGVWKHGDAGGQMWGVVKKTVDLDASAPDSVYGPRTN